MHYLCAIGYLMPAQYAKPTWDLVCAMEGCLCRIASAQVQPEGLIGMQNSAQPNHAEAPP